MVFPIYPRDRLAARAFGEALDQFARLRHGRVTVRQHLLWCEHHHRNHRSRFWEVKIAGPPVVQRWVRRYGVPALVRLWQQAI